MILERIKTLCKARNVSIYTLEKELGFGKGTIGRWKSASPTVDNVKAVAEYFDVSVDWLISGGADVCTTGRLTVCVDGEEVCGCQFDSGHKLVSLIGLFANGENIHVVISKSGVARAEMGPCLNCSASQ